MDEGGVRWRKGASRGKGEERYQMGEGAEQRGGRGREGVKGEQRKDTRWRKGRRREGE